MDRPANDSRASAVERVRAALACCGVPSVVVREFAESTATAAAAAAALGTTVERIVKSLVFVSPDGPLLVLASGANRVDLEKLGGLVGGPARRANADQVRAVTGFAIGGVPPVGHSTAMVTYIDRDLLDQNELWAAAGTPNAVFVLDPETLVRITRGKVVDIAA
jgi:prolyl-tRNA editing enzyme YbaK/EbsC (Cys-tRNA(Pro) deacylase)